MQASTPDMSAVPSLVDRSTVVAVNYLVEEIPDAAAVIVDKLLATEQGRAALKRKAPELIPIVVDVDPERAVKRVSELWVDADGPPNFREGPRPSVPVGPLALQLALGCDVQLVGIAINDGDEVVHVCKWFQTFEFPTCDCLSSGEMGIAWHALLTMIAERRWHVSVREAWEAWVNNSDEWQCAPFRPLNGSGELGAVATARNHTHGAVVVHWHDLVELVGGPLVVAAIAADMYEEMAEPDDDDENPYEGCDILAKLEDELLVEIAHLRDAEGREVTRSNNLVSHRGEPPKPTRPWLTIEYS